jgi:hypothetical protein
MKILIHISLLMFLFPVSVFADENVRVAIGAGHELCEKSSWGAICRTNIPALEVVEIRLNQDEGEKSFSGLKVIEVPLDGGFVIAYFVTVRKFPELQKYTVHLEAFVAKGADVVGSPYMGWVETPDIKFLNTVTFFGDAYSLKEGVSFKPAIRVGAAQPFFPVATR